MCLGNGFNNDIYRSATFTLTKSPPQDRRAWIRSLPINLNIFCVSVFTMVLAVPTNEKNVRTPLPPSDPPTSADIYAASDYLNRVRFRVLSADDAQTRPTDEDIANAHEYLHCVVAKKAAEGKG